MTSQTLHAQIHTHGPHCGHAVIEHRDHGDYLHSEGHLEHVKGDTIEQHALDVDEKNPARCTPSHACGGHPVDHEHGLGCAHAAIRHGDHVDYLVDGHLHHPCDKHCDDHGPITVKGA